MKRFFRGLLILSLLAVAPQLLWGQSAGEGNDRIASLLKSLAIQKEDTGKVKLLNDLAFEYNKISPYDGIKYGIQSLALAEDLNWEKGKARANSCIGANYFSLSDYPNAYKYWLNSLKINRELGNNMGIANHLHNIGNIYFVQKNYAKALEYYQQGLDLSQKTENKPIMTASFTAIGKVYAKQNNYAKALECYFKALSIDQELGIKGNMASDQIDIGSIYSDQGSFSKALDMLAEAKVTKQHIGDKNGAAKAYSLIGSVYLQIARSYASGALSDKTFGTKAAVLKNAADNLDSALAIDLEIGYLDNMQQSYHYLSSVLEMEGNYPGALDHYKKFTEIRDSIFSREKQDEIYNMDKKAELESKTMEWEKERQAKKNQQVVLIAAIILIGLTTLFVLKNYKTQKKYNALLNKEKDKALETVDNQSTLLTQIAYTQAHEVRGPVSTILGLAQIYNHDDTNDPMNKELIEGIIETTKRLDKVITEIVRQENELNSNNTE